MSSNEGRVVKYESSRSVRVGVGRVSTDSRV